MSVPIKPHLDHADHIEFNYFLFKKIDWLV
jgi:hypothetical protein